MRRFGTTHEGQKVLISDDFDDATIWQAAVFYGCAFVAILPDAQLWVEVNVREEDQ